MADNNLDHDNINPNPSSIDSDPGKIKIGEGFDEFTFGKEKGAKAAFGFEMKFAYGDKEAQTKFESFKNDRSQMMGFLHGMAEFYQDAINKIPPNEQNNDNGLYMDARTSELWFQGVLIALGDPSKKEYGLKCSESLRKEHKQASNNFPVGVIYIAAADLINRQHQPS